MRLRRRGSAGLLCRLSVGEDNLHITSIDEDGVALKALNAPVTHLQGDNAALRLQRIEPAAKVNAIEAARR